MMENTINRPDPVDGLHLALLQQRRDQLSARAAGRYFGIQEGLQVFMALMGIGLLVWAVFFREDRAQSVAVGAVLIAQGFFLWMMTRSTAGAQLKLVEKQIEAESRRTDAPVVAEAAMAARELLLKG